MIIKELLKVLSLPISSCINNNHIVEALMSTNNEWTS